MIRKKSKYHYKPVCNNIGQLGIIGGWSFNDSNYFLNCETGESIEVDKNLTGITIIDGKEWNDSFKKKNYPDDLFDNGPNHNWYRKTNSKKLGHTDRQKNYGIIHDIYLKHVMEEGTNGIWHSDFVRGVANIASFIALSEDTNLYEKFENNTLSGNERNVLIEKYLIGSESVYSQYCDKMSLLGDKPNKVSDEEIVQLFKTAITSRAVCVLKTIVDNPMFENTPLEFNYYFNIAKQQL